MANGHASGDRDVVLRELIELLAEIAVEDHCASIKQVRNERAKKQENGDEK